MKEPRRGGASFVAAGILASRVVGLVRERVFAHYFGSSEAADAFKAALRIPNVLQNLFGEGVLSASFIPVYSRMRAEGREEEARTLSRVVGSLLLVASAVLCTVGVVGAEVLVDLLAPGFTGGKRELATRIVRILFPGVGLLVLSAWCLGVLNSHRRFFLPYVAPVLWSLAIIASLLAFGGTTDGERLAEIAAWGVVVGSALQLLVQLPSVLRLIGGFRLTLALRSPGVSTVVKNFTPVVGGRGVVQISAWIDSCIASLLPTGAVAALAYAQTISMLPVSLFGMSIAAAELPELSSAVREGAISEGANEEIRRRINRGLRRMLFFVVPTVVAFLLFGDLIVAALYQTGSFTADDTRYVWAVLAGSAVGLVATTAGRLYSSTFYALHDTRTPLRYAVIRVVFVAVLGVLSSLVLPPLVGFDLRWGTVGLTASAGVSGWVEYLLLKRGVTRRVGATGVEVITVVKLWGSALVASAIGWSLRAPVLGAHPIVQAVCVLGVTGGVYVVLCAVARIEEARRIVFRR